MNLFTRQPEPRPGFTLVELLLVMAIIAVLSSLALVVIAQAQDDARRSATQSRMGMLNAVLQQRIESYEERRLPVDVFDYMASPDDRRFARILRQRILVDIINVEMPRFYHNIAFNQATSNGPQDVTYPTREFTEWVLNANMIQDKRIIDDLGILTPALARRFRQGSSPLSSPGLYPEGGSVSAMAQLTFFPNDPGTFPDLKTQTTLSEYLYLILLSSENNGISAVESLGNSAFADTDDDQFMEVVDSWGNPIFFQIEMYSDNGILAQSLSNSGFPPNLTSNLVLDDGEAVAVRNLRIRVVSTGNDNEVITN